MRVEGGSAARRKVYFPPQQKPAAPILREEVEKGGGEVRRSWKNFMIRGRTTDARQVMTHGMTIRMAWRI